MKTYLRFGEFPKSGKSGIGDAWRRQAALYGEMVPTEEQGISVYEAVPVDIKGAKKWRPLVNELQTFMGVYGDSCKGTRTIYLITGEELPEGGSDGEPLLKADTIKVLKKLSFKDIYHKEIDPGLYDDDWCQDGLKKEKELGIMEKSTLREFLEAAALDELSKITEPKRSGLPVDQLGLKPGGGVHNIITVYNQATPEEKEYWGKWYHNAKSDVEDLAKTFNLPFPVAAAIVAVLSPGNKWNSNLVAAEKLLKGEEKINAYPRQAERARNILKKGDTKLVSGPKVTVFFKSLMDPASVEKDMVLDGHAINIWRGAKENLKGLKNPSTKERAQMIQDYNKAAELLGVPVQAVQATTWYIWKYTGKSAPLPVEKGVYDVSSFKGAKPANDNASELDALLEEFLDEFNAMGTGAVQGYTGPLGGDPEPTHKKLWSNPKEGKAADAGYNPMPSELWEIEWPMKEGYGNFSPTSEPGYFYHATNLENVYDIIHSGELETHRPDFGTEQDEWPDGSVALRSYFGTSTKHVEPFYPEGKPAILRVPVGAAKFKKERGTGDIFTNQNIPTSAIEIWSTNDNAWIPLTSLVLSENVLDKMGQKHVGGASRKAPYGDTYVGFSSGKNEDESGRDKQSKIVQKVNKNLDKKPYSLHNPPGMGISITRPSLKDRK